MIAYTLLVSSYHQFQKQQDKPAVLLKSYFRYKKITSQNVSSDAQIKNFSIL